MSETLALRGRLAIAEKLTYALTNGIDCDIDELRSLADKYENKASLKEDKILLVADRIKTQVKKLRELEEQIKSIKSDLGE